MCFLPLDQTSRWQKANPASSALQQYPYLPTFDIAAVSKTQGSILRVRTRDKEGVDFLVGPPNVTQDQGGASGRSTTRATGENSSRGTLRVLAYNESFSEEMQSICIPSEAVAHQVVAFLENIEYALALLTKARGGVQLDFEHPPTRNQGPSGHVEVVSMASKSGIICIAFR